VLFFSQPPLADPRPDPTNPPLVPRQPPVDPPPDPLFLGGDGEEIAGRRGKMGLAKRARGEAGGMHNGPPDWSDKLPRSYYTRSSNMFNFKLAFLVGLWRVQNTDSSPHPLLPPLECNSKHGAYCPVRTAGVWLMPMGMPHAELWAGRTGDGPLQNTIKTLS